MINNKYLWDELYNLELDVQEWLQTLEEKGRRDFKTIWSNFNTRRIVRLTEELLRDFKTCLDLSNGNKKETKLYQIEAIKSYKILKEIKRSLDYD